MINCSRLLIKININVADMTSAQQTYKEPKLERFSIWTSDDCELAVVFGIEQAASYTHQWVRELTSQAFFNHAVLPLSVTHELFTKRINSRDGSLIQILTNQKPHHKIHLQILQSLVVKTYIAVFIRPVFVRHKWGIQDLISCGIRISHNINSFTYKFLRI